MTRLAAERLGADFSDAVQANHLDQRGWQIPIGMSFVDFIVEEDERTLLRVQRCARCGCGPWRASRCHTASGFQGPTAGPNSSEADVRWGRHYLADCVVVTVRGWSTFFPRYPLSPRYER